MFAYDVSLNKSWCYDDLNSNSLSLLVSLSCLTCNHFGFKDNFMLMIETTSLEVQLRVVSLLSDNFSYDSFERKWYESFML